MSGKEVITIIYRYITYEDRKRLAQLYANGASISAIALTLNVHISTVYRELAKGSTNELDQNGRIGYDAELAQKATQASLRQRGRKEAAVKPNSDGD